MRRLLALLSLLLALAASAQAGLYPARDDGSGLWGYIDETGAWAIAPQYEGAAHFHGGCAIVSMDVNEDAFSTCEGIIDAAGAWLLAPQYTLFDFCDTGAGDIYFVADYSGEESRMGFFNIPNRFFSGLRWAECIAYCNTPYVEVSVGEGDRYTASGLADRMTGEVVLPIAYDYSTGLYDWGIGDGFVVGHREDEDEVELVQIGVGRVALPEGVYLESCTAVSEGLVPFIQAEDGLMGYLNTSGEIVIPAQYQWAEAFMDGYANVQTTEDVTGIIDRAGRMILRCESERMPLLYQGMAAGLMRLQWEDEWGLAAPDGTVLCRHQWPGVWDVFLHEVAADGPLWALCSLSDEEYAWALVSRTGEVLTDPIWRSSGWGLFTDAQGWQAVGNADGLWGYVDAYGREVIPFRYPEARNFEGALARVRFDESREGYIDRAGNAVYTWASTTE